MEGIKSKLCASCGNIIPLLTDYIEKVERKMNIKIEELEEKYIFQTARTQNILDNIQGISRRTGETGETIKEISTLKKHLRQWRYK